MPTFSIKLSQPEYDALKARSEQKGSSMADVAKSILFTRAGVVEPKLAPMRRPEPCVGSEWRVSSTLGPICNACDRPRTSHP